MPYANAMKDIQNIHEQAQVIKQDLEQRIERILTLRADYFAQHPELDAWSNYESAAGIDKAMDDRCNQFCSRLDRLLSEQREAYAQHLAGGGKDEDIPWSEKGDLHNHTRRLTSAEDQHMLTLIADRSILRTVWKLQEAVSQITARNYATAGNMVGWAGLQISGAYQFSTEQMDSRIINELYQMQPDFKGRIADALIAISPPETTKDRRPR